MASTIDRGDFQAPQAPPGYVGPVLLSANGRRVWWTGKVAIGLRYFRDGESQVPAGAAPSAQKRHGQPDVRG